MKLKDYSPEYEVKCKNCKFWDPQQDLGKLLDIEETISVLRQATTLSEVLDDVGSERKVCCRFPPSPTLEGDFWPETAPDEWCGEFQYAENRGAAH